FLRAEHVHETRINAWLPLLWALDFNVDPMSSVIAQTDGRTVWVLDEIYLRDASTKNACEEFVQRYPKHDAGVVIYGDSSAFQRQTTGSTDYQVIQEYSRVNSDLRRSLEIRPANPAVRDRINMMNRQLRTASGEIGMVIDPRCKELIR